MGGRGELRKILESTFHFKKKKSSISSFLLSVDFSKPEQKVLPEKHFSPNARNSSSKRTGDLRFLGFPCVPPHEMQKTRFFCNLDKSCPKKLSAAKVFTFWFISGIFIRQQRILRFRALRAALRTSPPIMRPIPRTSLRLDARPIGTQERLKPAEHRSPKGD